MTLATKGLPETRSTSLPFRIDVIDGPDKGRGFHLERMVDVGTSELCALRLTDEAVSRRHLRIEARGRRVRLVDEGSKNGTWLGQVRVGDVEVPALTEVRLGGTVLRVDVDRERAGRPSPISSAPPTAAGFGPFIGSSPELTALFALLTPAAASEAAILVEGDTGVGKEVLAEAIHGASRRRDGPFVVAVAGALITNNIDGEFFGTAGRPGLFELARGGTLLLDEVGGLLPDVQARVLALLDRARHADVDVRLLASTSRNLEREVEEGRFRLELFHRLAVIRLRVPPLRDRPEDIEPLARHFLAGFGVTAERAEELLRPVLDGLRRQAWPGNARELRNSVERLVLFGERPTEGDVEARPAGLSAIATSGLPYRRARELAIESFTESYIENMLERHAGNVTRAAVAAGIARRHFHRLKRPAG